MLLSMGMYIILLSIHKDTCATEHRDVHVTEHT